MKTLIIAEKPSVAADLAKALGRVPKKGDAYENDELVITSAIGHLVELFMPEDIDKRFSFWRLDDLPIVPERFQLKPIEKTQDRFKEVVKLIKRRDVGTVVNACDAGREGELIFSYIYDLSGVSKPVKRLWMSSMTQDGIRAAWQELREGEQMQHLADAARSRSEADWLIGMNGTRAITKRLFGSRKGSTATIGRVQTPTLAIVMEREREIRAFRPRAFSRLEATFELVAGEYVGTYQRPEFRKSDDEHDRADRIWDRAVAEAVASAVKAGEKAEVRDEKKRTTQIAPRLYDLTSLQREANNRYGFPARRTLQVAQALYERHKMITYPRTDSRALPEDYVPTVKATLGNLGGDLAPLAEAVLKNGWVQPSRRIFNNAEVTDHFAIIPTAEASADLDEAEAKVFDMIARRFVAVFHPVAQFDQTTRTSTVAGHAFRSDGKVLVEPGWLAVYGRTSGGENEERTLPPVGAEDGRPPHSVVTGVSILDEVTKPPARYTEATLLSAMENAGKLIEEEDFADAMAERGLGTPATRAATIEHLISEKYISREGRELVPTAKAENVLDFLSHVRCEVLTSPALTGEWEFKLRKVEQGQLSRGDFMAAITDLTRSIVEKTKGYTDSREAARELAWMSFTDGRPMLEYDRKWASQDGKVEVYKTVGNRRFSEEEVRKLVEARRIGPLDNFVSAKSGKKFSALLTLEQDERGVWKPKFQFEGGGAGGAPINLETLDPVGRHPRTGDPIYETPLSYVVRVKDGSGEKQLYKLPRNLLGREIPRVQYLKYLETGKTDVLDKFWSRRTRRPFSAILAMKADGSGFDFEFPPRAPRAEGEGGKRGARRGVAAKGEAAEADGAAERRAAAAAPAEPAVARGKPAAGRGKAKPVARADDDAPPPAAAKPKRKAPAKKAPESVESPTEDAPF